MIGCGDEFWNVFGDEVDLGIVGFDFVVVFDGFECSESGVWF